jgi:small subunit ribosomal protein S4e
VDLPWRRIASKLTIPRNGLSFIEIPENEKKLKICKIIDKKTLRGNKNQLNLSDGRNILTEEKIGIFQI